MKKAFITGITGQDGSYLAELLLEKGYEVHGMKRRSSSWNTQRIDHLYQDLHENSRFRLHYGDLSDSSNLIRLIHDIEPDEIYNLAAQSHVKVSWDCPEYTADNDGLGTLRLLEAIRINKLENKTRFYQASTSELYGLIQAPIQNEKTPFYPRSPYGVAKLYAYWIAVNYRESFNMFACNGILFNHESPRRGETFVTRKITMAATRIKMGLQDKLYLGNLSAKRDWGHAKDYVEGMWRILQADHPSDYVLATGTTTSIRDFCRMAFHELDIELEFQGEGVNEKGIDKATGRVLIEVDPRYFRPAEVDLLLGDATKAKTELGWQPHYDLPALVKEMVAEDLKLAEKEKMLQGGHFSVSSPRKDIKIYVAGHTGLVGSAIMRELQKKGYNNLVYRTSQELDLRDSEATRQFFEKEKPEWVIQAAAKVGGIVGNNTYPVEFMLENFKIQNNVIENSRRYGVKKLLFLGSSCIYPRETPQPMREEHLLSGYLEKTNEGYALAKICGIKLCNAYNREYGTNYISVMPCNMYGINDTYHPQNAHVIPMLIRRFHEAKINNLPEVTVWGTGKPRREFMYAGDCAEAVVWLMENKDAKDVGDFINIGSGKDMTIAEMAQIVKEVVGYEGKLVYDTSKPDGTMLKLMDVSRINALGWHAHTDLREGIKIAYQDFLNRHIV